MDLLFLVQGFGTMILQNDSVQISLPFVGYSNQVTLNLIHPRDILNGSSLKLTSTSLIHSEFGEIAKYQEMLVCSLTPLVNKSRLQANSIIHNVLGHPNSRLLVLRIKFTLVFHFLDITNWRILIVICVIFLKSLSRYPRFLIKLKLDHACNYFTWILLLWVRLVYLMRCICY